MARHAYRAKVRSYTGVPLKHIGLQEALEMVASGQAFRISRLKADQLEIKLISRTNDPNPTASISAAESHANAAALGRKPPRKSFMGRAAAKVRAWPHVADDRAVITCGGMVMQPDPQWLEEELRKTSERNLLAAAGAVLEASLVG